MNDIPLADDGQEPTDASRAGAKALDKSYAETKRPAARGRAEAMRKALPRKPIQRGKG
jgi:hypothetical protein